MNTHVRIHVLGGMSVTTVDGWFADSIATKIVEGVKTLEVRNRKTNALVTVVLDKVTMVEEFTE